MTPFTKPNIFLFLNSNNIFSKTSGAGRSSEVSKNNIFSFHSSSVGNILYFSYTAGSSGKRVPVKASYILSIQPPYNFPVTIPFPFNVSNP